ncbi:MAG: signal peptidase II [Stackebrandtia sp.]
MLSIRDETVDASETEETPRPRRRRFLLGLFAATALTAVAVDVASKALALQHLTPGRAVPLPGGVLYLRLSHNSGAAFGIARDYTWALTMLAVLVVGAICWYAWRHLGSTPWAAGLGLIAGGAAGNLIDRFLREPGFMLGEVVDFVSIGDPPVWPIFNAADSCLVVGVSLVVLMEVTDRHADGGAGKAVKPDRDDSSVA